MKKRINRWLLSVVLMFSCAVTAFASPRMLVPGGSTIGVKLFTKGLVVTGFEETSAAKAAGIKKGDIIVEVDGTEVHTAEALRTCLAEEPVVVTVLRDGKEAQFRVKPKEQQLGTYVRDSISGIGTVTYYNPDTRAFGALGHGVNDVETSTLMPVEAGVAVSSSVEQIEKGRHGTPGELKGKFDVTKILGDITTNSTHGIFGTMTVPIQGKPMPVAEGDQIKVGPAKILSNVEGTEVSAYSVEILKLYPEAKESGRNLLIKVTDPRLLRKTGGIVQGMSGSPIIQDGKLIGAVTHVLVNDPTKGYGIFIENMLDAAE